MKRKKLKGFTLVELVICIAIIAILISIAIPQYTKAKLSAIVATHNSNVQTIKSAAIMAEMEKESGEITISDVAKFVEGSKLPKIAKEIPGAKEWSISKSDNNIVVSPGLVKLSDGKIVEDGN